MVCLYTARSIFHKWPNFGQFHEIFSFSFQPGGGGGCLLDCIIRSKKIRATFVKFSQPVELNQPAAKQNSWDEIWCDDWIKEGERNGNFILTTLRKIWKHQSGPVVANMLLIFPRLYCILRLFKRHIRAIIIINLSKFFSYAHRHQTIF